MSGPPVLVAASQTRGYSRRPRSGPDARATIRALRVLGLAAGGEAGHLRQTYRKLEVASREELALFGA